MSYAYKMQLTDRMELCPIEWQGFMNVMEKNSLANGTYTDNGFSTDILNVELEKYGGKFVDSCRYHVDSYVMFENEEDLVLFKLKFG